MKKILKHVFVVAFVTIASYGVYTNQKSDMVSDLVLANIEAMALNDEVDEECNDCYILPATCKDWGWGGCKGYYHHRG
ncbi:NVEALA domain-containing protein [Bacteroides finegoldii]|uniref:NVEALA domain-containing protein n=1 Tax=Bacteroides finegoldii TaxID=338188 RepID=UPI00189E7986|nr:NVEALA domain-containing protein [Bacteroides finegoldii]